MSESFAGITVPEGEPGGLEDAAGRFQSLGHALSGVSSEMRGTRARRVRARLPPRAGARLPRPDPQRLGLAR